MVNHVSLTSERDLVLMKADLSIDQISKDKDFQYVLETTMFNYVQNLLNSVHNKENLGQLLRFFPKWKWVAGGGTFNPKHDSHRVTGMLRKNDWFSLCKEAASIW